MTRPHPSHEHRDPTRGELAVSVVALRDYFDARLDGLSERMDERFQAHLKANEAAFHAAETATLKSEEATNDRFESVNEFRAQLNDQARTFVVRSEAQVVWNRTGERLTEIADRVNDASLLRRPEYNQAHSGLVERVEQLQQRLDRTEGRSVGLKSGWVIFLGAVAALGTLVSLLVAVRVGA